MASTPILPDDDFMADAACLGAAPDIFFPERGDRVGPAKDVCSTCPVRRECLEYAMANRIDHGVWGGTSERERRKLRRVRRLAVALDEASRSVA